MQLKILITQLNKINFYQYADLVRFSYNNLCTQL